MNLRKDKYKPRVRRQRFIMQNSSSPIFSVTGKGWEHSDRGSYSGRGYILSLNENWARLSSRLELAQQQRGATTVGVLPRRDQSSIKVNLTWQGESVLRHTNGVPELVAPLPAFVKAWSMIQKLSESWTQTEITAWQSRRKVPIVVVTGMTISTEKYHQS